jgi:glutamate/tyrosine decarboxylase-like PLP-dependent enzyme
MSFHSTTEFSKFFLATGNANNAEIGQFLHNIVDLGISFKSSETVSAEGIQRERETVSFDRMPESGLSYSELAHAFSQIACKSSNWGSPNFLGFPDAGNNVAGLAAAVLTPLLNQNMANQNICSPEATFIEMEVVHWMRAALGYSVPSTYSMASEIGGVLTLGGCLSNTISLVAARERLFPGSSLGGIPVLPSKVRVLVPNVIEHYSIRSAMAWLSLGERNVVRVPVDAEFRMDQDALERIIDEERAQGNSIIACVAYAGDSRSMRIDHLDSLADVLQKHGIWFHVDACHGGQLAFSELHRSKLRGIEKADSVTLDPHKVLIRSSVLTHLPCFGTYLGSVPPIYVLHRSLQESSRPRRNGDKLRPDSQHPVVSWSHHSLYRIEGV